jgi:hypothetical protein
MDRVASSRKGPIRRAGDTTLTREYYVSPEIFEKEICQIFFKQWTYVGHVSQIPNVGDYFLHNFVNEPSSLYVKALIRYGHTSMFAVIVAHS